MCLFVCKLFATDISLHKFDFSYGNNVFIVKKKNSHLNLRGQWGGCPKVDRLINVRSFLNSGHFVGKADLSEKQ